MMDKTGFYGKVKQIPKILVQMVISPITEIIFILKMIWITLLYLLIYKKFIKKSHQRFL